MLKSDLVLLAADVDHVVAHPAADHGYAPGQGVVGRRQLVWPDGGHRGPGPVIGQLLSILRSDSVVTHPELVTLSAPGPRRGCLSTSSVMIPLLAPDLSMTQ